LRVGQFIDVLAGPCWTVEMPAVWSLIDDFTIEDYKTLPR
jgi:hypothetical protein